MPGSHMPFGSCGATLIRSSRIKGTPPKPSNASIGQDSNKPRCKRNARGALKTITSASSGRDHLGELAFHVIEIFEARRGRGRDRRNVGRYGGELLVGQVHLVAVDHRSGTDEARDQLLSLGRAGEIEEFLRLVDFG